MTGWKLKAARVVAMAGLLIAGLGVSAALADPGNGNGGGNGNGYSSGVRAPEGDVPIDTGDFERTPVAAGAADEDIPF